MDQQKMIFGFFLLLVLSALAATIALGKVTEDTSHGLMPLLSALSVLSGNFANWAFTHRDGKDPAKDEKEIAA
jgi:hypothetical protein